MLMITFAFLGNTLFLTILVSMLSNTFSKIVKDATAEIAFRRAVLTFEGVKSDAIFAYYPPFNILALLLIPLRLLLSPRYFHKTNVYLVRLLNAPLLLIVSFIERRSLWKTPRRKARFMQPSILQRALASWLFRFRWTVHGDIAAVFETEPPQSTLDEIAAADDLSHAGLEEFLQGPRHPGPSDQHQPPADTHQHTTIWNSSTQGDAGHPSAPTVQFDSLRKPSTEHQLIESHERIPAPDEDVQDLDKSQDVDTTPDSDHHSHSIYSHFPTRGPSRKDSLNFTTGASDAGIVDSLADVLTENSDRLDGVEQAVKRMEELLQRMLKEGLVDIDADDANDIETVEIGKEEDEAEAEETMK